MFATVLLLEGESFLFGAALALLSVLEPRLFFPERKKLLGLLQRVIHLRAPYSSRPSSSIDISFLRNRGDNKAALEVAKRERLPTDGPKYAIYGLGEDMLWDETESMDGKDST